jgi:uncharacterized protein YkwD
MVTNLVWVGLLSIVFVSSAFWGNQYTKKNPYEAIPTPTTEVGIDHFGNPFENQKPTAVPTITSSEDLMIDAINEVRHLHRLPDLQKNNMLQEAASASSNYVANNHSWPENFASSSIPWNFVKKTGYKIEKSAILLADDMADPKTIVQNWLTHEVNRDIILATNIKEIGVGIKEGTIDGVATKIYTVVVASQATPTSYKPPVQVECNVQGKIVITTLQDCNSLQNLPSGSNNTGISAKEAEIIAAEQILKGDLQSADYSRKLQQYNDCVIRLFNINTSCIDACFSEKEKYTAICSASYLGSSPLIQYNEDLYNQCNEEAIGIRDTCVSLCKSQNTENEAKECVRPSE